MAILFYKDKASEDLSFKKYVASHKNNFFMSTDRMLLQYAFVNSNFVIIRLQFCNFAKRRIHTDLKRQFTLYRTADVSECRNRNIRCSQQQSACHSKPPFKALVISCMCTHTLFGRLRPSSGPFLHTSCENHRADNCISNPHMIL